MKRAFRALLIVATLGVIATGSAGCFDSSNADVAAKNLSTEAEQFKVARKIIFYNGITDKYMFEVDGLCSIDPAGAGLRALAVVCKVGPDKYIKDYLGLSDNVSYIVQQLRGVDVSTYHYEVVFKPESIVPNFDRPSNSDKGATGDTGTLSPSTGP